MVGLGGLRKRHRQDQRRFGPRRLEEMCYTHDPLTVGQWRLVQIYMLPKEAKKKKKGVTITRREPRILTIM